MLPGPLAIIDCAIENSAINCYNLLVEHTLLPMTYHCPHLEGLGGLEIIKMRPSAVVVFGSYSNVGDNLSWHQPLTDYVLTQLKHGVPVLGICFGHQLVAQALGSKLGENTSGKLEQGVREISFPRGKEKILVSHRFQIAELSPSFQTIAQSPICRHEVIVHRDLPFVGIQGHPEGSSSFVANTLTVSLPGEELEKAMAGGRRFMDAFFSTVKSYYRDPQRKFAFSADI